ncbi:MAG: NAD-dependent epimerase/dehydratase family protein [Bacteroidales bacterium]
MNTILLTGGNGFIGKNIKESFLKDKYRILAPSSKELNTADTDQVDAFFENNKIDFVIHAAAKPGHRNAKDHADLLYTNSRMFFNLARHADKYEKMLNIGSGAIYDMRYYEPKMKETYFGTHIPTDEHGYNKYICGKYIESTENIIDLRIFGIFGKYEEYAIRFISNAICKTLYNLPITLRQDRKFDYLYIADLLPILDYFLQNKMAYKAYNITPNQSISLLHIAEIIQNMSGNANEIQVGTPGMGLEYSGNNDRLQKEMKEVQFTPIHQAIKELFEWYHNQQNTIQLESLLVDK